MEQDIAKNDYLTSEELIAAASSLGAELTERKLKYYVTLGILDKPVKRSKAGKDGRILYHPASSAEKLVKIKELQDLGLTLSQIKNYFSDAMPEELSNIAELSARNNEHVMLQSIMSVLTGEELQKAFARFYKKIANTTDEKIIIKAAEDYYSEILTPAMGSNKASLEASRFLSGAPAELSKKRIAKLLEMSSYAVKSKKHGSFSERIISLVSQIRRENLPLSEVTEKTKNDAFKIHSMQEKYVSDLENLKGFFDISSLLKQPFWFYMKALLYIENGVRTSDFKLLDKAVALALKADEIIDIIEEIIKKLKELLVLYSEN